MHYYCLHTNLAISPGKLEDLRRKIAPIEGKKEDLWHNHQLEGGKTIHRYPSVQYKIWKHRFAIIALPYAMDTLFELMKKMPLTIRGYAPIDLLKLEKFPLVIEPTTRMVTYRCNNWLPMDSDYYRLYQGICTELGISPSEPSINHPTVLTFFAGLLKEQILKNAYSLGVLIDPDLLVIRLPEKPLKHSLVKINNQLWSKISGLQFEMNLRWPIHLGVGKRTAIGFGMLKPIKNLNHGKQTHFSAVSRL